MLTCLSTKHAFLHVSFTVHSLLTYLLRARNCIEYKHRTEHGLSSHVSDSPGDMKISMSLKKETNGTVLGRTEGQKDLYKKESVNFELNKLKEG